MNYLLASLHTLQSGLLLLAGKDDDLEPAAQLVGGVCGYAYIAVSSVHVF